MAASIKYRGIFGVKKSGKYWKIWGKNCIPEVLSSTSGDALHNFNSTGFAALQETRSQRNYTNKHTCIQLDSYPQPAAQEKNKSNTEQLIVSRKPLKVEI